MESFAARGKVASGKINDLRQFIQTNYTIKEIAELPEGTIEYCGIKVYLLDIENDRPNEDDIVVRRYTAGEKKARRAAVTSLEVADDTFVMLAELEEKGDWSIDRIFAQQDEDYLSFQNSSVRKDTIGNVAEVFRGKSVTKKDPAGNIGVVNISNIGEYEIDYAGLDHLQEEERRVSTYLLQEGDVLLPARGTAIRTAVFHEQSYPCIASSNLIVIRPDLQVLPHGRQHHDTCSSSGNSGEPAGLQRPVQERRGMHAGRRQNFVLRIALFLLLGANVRMTEINEVFCYFSGSRIPRNFAGNNTFLPSLFSTAT